MKKAVWFIILYVYSFLKLPWNWLRYRFGKAGSNPLVCSAVDLIDFKDPAVPDRTFGVAVFVLPPNFSPDDYSEDLLGPFGYSSRITLRGKHLYGRDTWGVPNEEMIEVNPELKLLAYHYPESTILLAGVRRGPFGRRIWPLNEPGNFMLVRK